MPSMQATEDAAPGRSTPFAVQDHAAMARALQLAESGLTTTTPNPRVGCVLVRDGMVVGEGWHEKAGEPHAEIHALRSAGEQARGAVAYVSLEPCSHYGRTPPCCDALIEAGVARVVAAMEDPNPRVAGQGLARLRSAGVTVACGLMEEAARELNIGFVSRMTRGRPWLRLKAAASLDGKTALANGSSQWITGPDARRDGHAWRARSCAVLTGIGTVRDDDPRLTVRDVPALRQPLRVIVDSRLETPLGAKILDGGGVLIACAALERSRAAALHGRGARIVQLPNATGKVDLPALMQELGRRGVNELLVEAGFRLNGSLLREGLVDELVLYVAPSLIGDAARGLFDLPPLTELARQRRLDLRDVRQVGTDLRILARPV
jgi:diaminohydroxyphosphoribosylaminopyrimidine deaminase/5-amino-6-(5-phosphoribosylamino)uracil reductase